MPTAAHPHDAVRTVYPATLDSVPHAREMLSLALDHLPERDRARALVALSELMTRCILRGCRDVEVVVAAQPDVVRVDLVAHDPRSVSRREARRIASGPLGLQIVGVSTDAWGIEHAFDSDAVDAWFELRAPAPG